MNTTQEEYKREMLEKIDEISGTLIHEAFYMPEVKVKYVVINPGEKRTRTHPGFRPEIEISDILINGGDISDDLYITILNKYRDRLENEIIFSLAWGNKKGAA